jgi:hypothetical protein
MKISGKTLAQVEKEKAKSERSRRIDELMARLRETDFYTLPDYDKEKPDILAQRQAWRDEIRQIKNKEE